MVLGLSILAFLCFPAVAKAQDAPDNFSVTPLLGNLPIQKGKSYFALRSQNHTTYKLPVMLSNDSDLPMIVTTNVNNAITADNGTISYSNNTVQPRGKMSLTNKVVGKRKHKLTLAPHSNQIVTYKIKTGNQGNGITLGGINATSVVDRQGDIQNKVTFVTGVSLNTPANHPNLKQLTFKKISTDYLATDANPSVVATLSNDKPQLLQHLHGKMVLKRGNKVLATKKMKDVSIAPNSDVKFYLPPKSMANGKYQVLIQLKDKRHTIDLKRNIVIN
ncbi:DUF916 and DUF3324 domain-containing protein [Fructilactobacillus cliffordii]|uniref:WxL protein peptidoglycan domain-containing protein n=1 Tax=Fructilactobacillus cliffordii TaxID=2940299 RepID=UPI00209253A5|nr:DUF916 domain-containing protein [Fructilactobacillus cliffordii]USS85877.1 DUF916 and DUF3324 domain-containing protein [Fructilactobacillus cliffordii]